jgi:7-keto-8-aminopelargonate synthetase-like enzyme
MKMEQEQLYSNMHLQSAPNTTTTINGKEYLFFSGTSYLGISMLPQFQEQIRKSIELWGTSYGSSRSANITLDVYQKGEQYLSSFLNTEDAVTVSSGTLASQFALNQLEQVVDDFYFMPKTHPSILPKNAKPIFIKDDINSELLNLENKTICIVTDAIAALETSPFSFDFINAISKTNTIYFLIDESHSLGVLGEKGNGVLASLSFHSNVEKVMVSSLGKAFGVNGGVIAGSQEFINSVKENPLFIGSAGMSPAFLDAFVKASSIYHFQLEKLQRNCTYVYDRLHHLEMVKISENYPVFFVNDDRIAAYLKEKNILITSFYYPATTQKINRIVLNANHSKEQLNVLIENLLSFDEK